MLFVSANRKTLKMWRIAREKLPLITAATIGAGIITNTLHQDTSKSFDTTHWLPPTRKELLSQLKERDFDVLIIGGGATGAGCALDAASRGLKTALVERDDYSSGISALFTLEISHLRC